MQMILIFCRKRSDADKIFIAVKQWLKERLKLQTSDEKSKVVNLKKNYSEFLGFRLKAVPKRNKYVVSSYMSEKALNRESEKLVEQIKYIEFPRNEKEEALAVSLYNSMVWGIHNYYRYATNVNLDCRKIQFRVNAVMRNRLRDRVKKQGIVKSDYVRKMYGASQQIRFIGGIAVCPIGYIKKKNPMYKKSKICKYTKEGREEIHKNLKFDELILMVMKMLAQAQIPNRSIEYMDNRISLYAAQYGKCAVTGKILWIDEIHCHHIKPVFQGGTDSYNNLVIVHKDVHKLIHAVSEDTIKAYLSIINPNSTMLSKINKYRTAVGNAAI